MDLGPAESDELVAFVQQRNPSGSNHGSCMVASTAARVSPPCSGCQWNARLLTAMKSSRSSGVNARVTRPLSRLGEAAQLEVSVSAKTEGCSDRVCLVVDVPDPELDPVIGILVIVDLAQGVRECVVEGEAISMLRDDDAPTERARKRPVDGDGHVVRLASDQRRLWTLGSAPGTWLPT